MSYLKDALVAQVLHRCDGARSEAFSKPDGWPG